MTTIDSPGHAISEANEPHLIDEAELPRRGPGAQEPGRHLARTGHAPKDRNEPKTWS
jgi:hypothetical protein